MKIEILGTGCPKCQTLAANAEAAAKRLGLPYELCKVTAIRDIMQRGVMMTPALAIDGQLKSVGKLLTEAEIARFLSEDAASGGTP